MSTRAGSQIVAAFAIAALLGCATQQDQRPAPGLRNSSETARTMVRLGDDLRENGDPDSARGMYQSAAHEDPSFAQPFIRLGDLQLAAGDAADAEASYRSALARSSSDPDALAGLAAALLVQTRVQEALETAQPWQGASARLARLTGVALDMLGRSQEAQAAYRHGLARAPADQGLRGSLAMSLAAADDMAGAEREARLLLAQPTEPGARANAVLVLALAGKQDDAREAGRALGSTATEALLARASQVAAQPSGAARAKALGLQRGSMGADDAR